VDVLMRVFRTLAHGSESPSTDRSRLEESYPMSVNKIRKLKNVAWAASS